MLKLVTACTPFIKPLLIAVFSISLIACQQSSNDHSSSEKPLVEFTDHWVKATHPGQTVAAAYMKLTSQKDLTLTHASADVTAAVEVHNMKMENGVMKMRHLDSLALPKGKTTALMPGGLHLMLFDLKAPLKAGTNVTFELCFADDQGKITTIPLTTQVKAPD